jgi:sugar lactone lactonase YvrE
MVVDAAGNLFVANVDNQTVTVYPPGSMTPSKTYARGFKKRLTNPLTVAVGADGTMYLVNYTLTGQGSELLEYPPGKMSATVSIPLNGGGEGLALDTSNNLYVSYNGSAGGRILKFAPGSKTGQDLGISLGFAGCIALDKNLNLLACDQTAPAVDVFPPGATKPSKVITQGFASPYAIAFGRYFQRLYLADNAGHDVSVYSYPDGALIGQIHRTFTAYGVAVSPAAHP